MPIKRGVSFLTEIALESVALHKEWWRGKCKKTVFAGGGHRTGFVPIYSVIDGGLPGCTAQRICLECGKGFQDFCFVPLRQPRIFGSAKLNRTTTAAQNSQSGTSGDPAVAASA